MATNIVYNDFRSGQIDEQFGYRSDLSIYNTSAHILENVVPFRAGGLTLREGTTVIEDGVTAERLIDFCISVTEHYFLALSLMTDILGKKKTRILIYTQDLNGAYQNVSGEGFIGPWETLSQIREIQYTQNYESVIFVQKDHPPFLLNRVGFRSFNCGPIKLDRYTGQTRAVLDDKGNPTYDKDGNPIEEEFLFSYDDASGKALFEERDFPCAVTFAANRLIFANSVEHPYRIWVSRPFKYNNFQDVEWYPSVDEKVTTDDYLKAIEDYTSKSEDLGIDPDTGVHQERRVTKKVSINGFVTITSGIYNADTGQLIGKEDVDTFKYTDARIEWKTIITDECSMELDIASDRNERIAWLAYVAESIIVGSATSEWAMPANITPTSAHITKIASYGSMDYGSARNGAQNVFYAQSGGKRLRSIFQTSEGYRFIEPSFQCESILDGPVYDELGNVIDDGVKEMHWQRVPEPRLYAVLADGSLSVLSYDPEYGMNAWCRWKTDGRFISLCVVDTERGQDVIALVERESGKTSVRSLEIFRKGIYTDHGGDRVYKATVVTNCIDSIQTQSLTKKILKVEVCAGGTKFTACQEGLNPIRSLNYKKRQVELPIYNRPTDQDMRIRIESSPSEPFEVHSLIVTMEVNE